MNECRQTHPHAQAASGAAGGRGRAHAERPIAPQDMAPPDDDIDAGGCPSSRSGHPRS